jgi:hypothetical protein
MEVQPIPFIVWSVISAAVFAATAFAYRTYLRKRKSSD